MNKLIEPAFKIYSELSDPEQSQEATKVLEILSNQDELLPPILTDPPEYTLDAFAYLIYASKMIHARPLGSKLIKLLLRSHLKIIYHHLSSGNTPQIQSALFLLIQIASHTSAAAIELQSLFNFNLKVILHSLFFNPFFRLFKSFIPSAKNPVLLLTLKNIKSLWMFERFIFTSYSLFCEKVIPFLANL
jgi:hypothetical protein